MGHNKEPIITNSLSITWAVLAEFCAMFVRTCTTNRAGQIERGGYSSFYFSYGTDGPNSLEVNFGHRTCYFVNGYNNCYIWCFPISLHVSFIRGFRAVSTMCELVVMRRIDSDVNGWSCAYYSALSRRSRFAASLDSLGWCKILRGRSC